MAIYLGLIAVGLCCGPLSAQTVSIGVFGLFHTTELWVRPATSQPLRIQKGATTVVLEGSRIAKFRFGHTAAVRVTSSSGGPADFELVVPTTIERQFRGVLRINPAAHELAAIIDMDLEVAVASVVAAESVPGAGLEALKAQAVMARSFFVQRRRRAGWSSPTGAPSLQPTIPPLVEATHAR